MDPASGTRVLIVEDERLLAELVRGALEDESGISVVGVAENVRAGEQLARQHSPDVILMDYHLPDGTGADLALRIRQFSPRTAVVMVTSDPSEEALRYALDAGAIGYIPKSSRPATVVEAVRRAAAGEIMVPAEALQILAGRRPRAATPAHGLTRRETEVLQMLCLGRDTRAIAQELSLEYNTVRGHAQRILEKLDARTRLEAVVRARELGLDHAGRGRS